MLAFIAAGIGLIAIQIYAIFGGADFGGGVWDLFASGPRRLEQREAVGEAMGPVWETNHVWLIYCIVLLFTCFPRVFADISVAFYAPLTLILGGVLLRGAAFAFRAHAYAAARTSRVWGGVFGIASTITPLLFGACAGALAQDSYDWYSPFALVIGAFALAVCAQNAAVFLMVETKGRPVYADFQRRAVWASLAVMLIGALALATARLESLRFSHELPWTLRWTIMSAMGIGAASLGAILRHWAPAARLLVIAEVLAILFGWYTAQAPYLIPGRVTIASAAAPDATLWSFLAISAGGAIVLVPSLWLLFAVFKGKNPAASD